MQDREIRLQTAYMRAKTLDAIKREEIDRRTSGKHEVAARRKDAVLDARRRRSADLTGDLHEHIMKATLLTEVRSRQVETNIHKKLLAAERRKEEFLTVQKGKAKLSASTDTQVFRAKMLEEVRRQEVHQKTGKHRQDEASMRKQVQLAEIRTREGLREQSRMEARIRAAHLDVIKREVVQKETEAKHKKASQLKKIVDLIKAGHRPEDALNFMNNSLNGSNTGALIGRPASANSSSHNTISQKTEFHLEGLEE